MNSRFDAGSFQTGLYIGTALGLLLAVLLRAWVFAWDDPPVEPTEPPPQSPKPKERWEGATPRLAALPGDPCV